MNKRNPLHQHAVDLYQPGRDISGCDAPPKPTITWLCPNCECQHRSDVVDPLIYKCPCGWYGTKHTLRRSEIPPTPWTHEEENTDA